jgi:hypothetical protein
MTVLARLEHWKEQGAISPPQHAHLASLARERPFSLFLELNVLLYAGVLAFVVGLGWTVATWSRHLGDVLILTVLTALLAACFWYCFSRVQPWSPLETTAPDPVLDYVLYLGTLVWGIELAYIEDRFHLLSGQWDIYLLATAALFFLLAYRFDNRLVLSLALSSLAAWFGIRTSHWVPDWEQSYREYALLYCLVVFVSSTLPQYRKIKQHFFGTYLNIVANVLLCAVLSGVFEPQRYRLWFVALLVACGASLAYGLTRRHFAFVAYAAVYGYIGVSALLLRSLTNEGAILGYFVVSAILMLFLLVQAARRFGRAA